ncbi:unnamed protein product [Prunus armeniaca]|uniref:Uncharacterized protein n=1 Tax=Prunus armeniaca TaxID=36596 RepID=A0A6J5WC20_PRUAR|nr:unnamed protein product [Prunus armeniaca]
MPVTGVKLKSLVGVTWLCNHDWRGKALLIDNIEGVTPKVHLGTGETGQVEEKAHLDRTQQSQENQSGSAGCTGFEENCTVLVSCWLGTCLVFGKGHGGNF